MNDIILRQKSKEIYETWKNYEMPRYEGDEIYSELKCMDVDEVYEMWGRHSRDQWNKYTNNDKLNSSLIDIKNFTLNSRLRHPPIITIRTKHNSVSFTDGRHRFVNMRKLGYKKLWMVVEEDDYDYDIPLSPCKFKIQPPIYASEEE